MDLVSLNFFITLLVSIRQDFAASDSAQDLAFHLNIILSSYKDGWLRINNVVSATKLQNGAISNFSAQDLYNEEVTENNATEKFITTFTLLGCKYLDILLKFLNLIEHSLNNCKRVRRQAHNEISDFNRLIECHNSMFMPFVDFKLMFDIMYGALTYLKSLYHGDETFTDTFIAHICILKNCAEDEHFAYPIKHLEDNDERSMYLKKFSKDKTALLNFLAGYRHTLSINNCIFSDNHQQTFDEFLKEFRSRYPRGLIGQIKDYINELMKNLQNEAISNGFYDLGFMYDIDPKETYVPSILRGKELEQMLLELI